MRVLIVTDQFPPRQFGGMAQHAWHMASYLGKNHEVEVLTLWSDRDRVGDTRESFSFLPILTKRWPQWDFHLVAREARRFRADVVHVCTAGLLDGRLAGEIPVVTRVVGNDFLRPWCGYNLPLRSLHYRVAHRGYQPPFSPMNPAQFRSSRPFRQKQIPSSKATTNETMGFVGRQEGMAAFATALVVSKRWAQNIGSEPN